MRMQTFKSFQCQRCKCEFERRFDITPTLCFRCEWQISQEKETKDMSDQEPMLQFFAYAHLPAHLQAISKPFGDLAENMVATLPRNPERSAGLRKLLEAKDCAVRANLYK